MIPTIIDNTKRMKHARFDKSRAQHSPGSDPRDFQQALCLLRPLGRITRPFLNFLCYLNLLSTKDMFFEEAVRTAVPDDGRPTGALVLTKRVE